MKRKLWRIAERKLKSWRRGKESRDEALQKKEFMELCKRKREEWRKKEMEEVNGIKMETEVWKYINKERKA